MVKKKKKQSKGDKPTKKTRRHFFLLIALIPLVVMIAGISLWIFYPPSSSDQSITLKCPRASKGGKVAAIVDGLSIDFPNQKLIEELKSILMRDGYVVDVFQGSDVTLNLYRCIPSMGYDLIIFRIHSAIFNPQLVPKEELFPAFFTTERYSMEKYLNEQFSGLVVPATPITPGLSSTETTQYFAVTPGIFVQASGHFDDTVIIVSSCFGAITDKAAKVFLEKGASVYIGWDGLVSVDHMDRATLLLIQEIVKDVDPYDATLKVNIILGPDPNSGGRLIAFR
ncbi:MAG: hypothetical protein NZ931_06060 [Aigarchaeota archaeon]|nr:hypothetical protein [Aigarchaeota archaeon]